MRAMVLSAPGTPLQLQERADPIPGDGQIRVKVSACGVCRTDLHVVDGDLPRRAPSVVPGHEVVGRVAEVGAGLETLAPGMRVGAAWLVIACGLCPFCRRGEENLCDAPVFTGYSINGGYAEYAVARADFIYPLPPGLDDLHAAPLLCAGIIGFRALRVAGTQKGERVGLFGFGASAHLALPVLIAWGCEVYVSTRGKSHAKLAESLGAKWVGGEKDKPPVARDRAIVFAPAGEVVVLALASLRKGGVVSINAIHLDQMPAFDYDSLLWGERQIRSVANMTRDDARDFLALAAQIGLRPRVREFKLDAIEDALRAIQDAALNGAAVITY